MKTNLKLVLLFLPTFILASCSSENYKNFHESSHVNKNLTLERVDELILSNPSGDQHAIGKLRFKFVSNKDNSLFAFYDEIKRRFLITDKKGVIQSILSGKGKGPGEIVKAGGYNFDEQNRLIVFDQGQMRITIFNLNGKVIKNAEIENTDYSMGGARELYAFEGRIYSDIIDKTFLGDLKEAGKSELVGVYNYDGKLVDTIGKYDPSVKEAKSYLIFPIIHVDFENRLLVSAHSNSFRIQMYNLNTQNRVTWFGAKTPHFKESDEYISPYLPRHEIIKKSIGVSASAGIYLLSNYVVLYFENLTKSFFETSYFNDKESYMSIYDKKSYDCYGEIALPYVLGNISGDKFYLIEDDNPANYTIGIYELRKTGD